MSLFLQSNHFFLQHTESCSIPAARTDWTAMGALHGHITFYFVLALVLSSNHILAKAHKDFESESKAQADSQSLTKPAQKKTLYKSFAESVTTRFPDLWQAHRQGSPSRFHTYMNPNLHTILSFKQLNQSLTQH